MGKEGHFSFEEENCDIEEVERMRIRREATFQIRMLHHGDLLAICLPYYQNSLYGPGTARGTANDYCSVVHNTMILVNV
jgi:hypothetical protein